MAFVRDWVTLLAKYLRGTGTNDNAAAGFIGEIIESTIPIGSAVALTTATAATVTSISLSPGDWDVWGQVDHSCAATTSVTQLTASFSPTTNTQGTQPANGIIDAEGLAVFSTAAEVPNGVVSTDVGPCRVSIPAGANQSVFLVALDTFTVAGISAFGTIRARRMR